MTEEVGKNNPLNGNGASSTDSDDQEDLFVSSYETAPVSAAKPATKTAEAVEDLMNVIDLNDPAEAAFAPLFDEPKASLPPTFTSAPAPEPVSLWSSTTITPPVTNNNSSQELPPPTPPAIIPSIPISLVQPMADFEVPSSEVPAPATVPVFSAPAASAPKPTVHFSIPNDSANKSSAPPPATNSPSQIQISVSDPHKIGDGMGSYMVYTVATKTTLPYFRRQSLSVNRRFSDFLGLHDKIQDKHAHLGRIVPPPPSKSVVGTAKIKFSKQDEQQQAASNEFIEKRRSALERYLQRNAEHPIICADPDFREFLELETDLPRSTSTSALSGAGVKRMFSFVTDTVSKMTYKMDETDTWFEQKQAWVEQLDAQLRKLYASVESLIHHRKELTTATGQLAKSTAILGNCEEHNSLSCALSQLAATHEKIEKVYERQSNNDFTYMAELLKDYIALIGSVRDVFHERVKSFQNLSTTEQALTRKREQKTRLELAMKHDRVPAVDDEIRELGDKVEKAKEDFETISQNIKQEFDRFELNRIRDFKQNFVKYMESLLETQESLVECWESFLPESKSIVV